tara:strand:+ start:1054 stop:2808 length:1755 start_codon:yes stop_codon:yes gene_type:complete
MPFIISRDKYLRHFKQGIEVSSDKEGTFTSLGDDRYEAGEEIPEGMPQLKSSDYDGYDDDLQRIITPEQALLQPKPKLVGLGSQSVKQGDITQLQQTSLRRGKRHQQPPPEAELLNEGLHLQNLNDESLDRPFDELREGLDSKVEYPLILQKKELLEMEKYSILAYERDLDDTQEEYDSWTIRGINTTIEGRQMRGGDANIYTNALCRIFLFPDKLLFAFKGTDPFASDTLMGDVMSDLQVKVDNLSTMGGIEGKTPYNELGIVHQGFNRFVDSLFPQVLDIIDKYPDRPFTLLGHSLGAITALIAGYRLYLERGIKPERIYQFGTPMGITTFGSIGNILDIINVIHTHDVVPNFMSIFNHHGTKIVIDIHDNYKVYQGGEHIPFIYKEPDTTKAYMVRKNFNIKDISWDNYFQGRGSAFTSFFNTAENVRSLWTGLSYPLMKKGRDRAIEVAKEWGGIFAHTKYKQHIENALPDEILLPSFDLDRDIREAFRKRGNKIEYTPNPKSSYKFNPIDDIYTSNKEYITSHDTHHIYKDKTTNEISIINQRQGQMKSRPLGGNAQPLGLYFYQNEEDIQNKVVMFKV